MISRENFDTFVTLIADGELDEYMIELLKAIDDRNGRRQDDVLRLVKSVYGPDAVVEVEGQASAASRPVRKPVDYVETDDVGDDQLGITQRLPTPIESAGAGDGFGGTTAPYSPVRDPMAAGPGEDDPNIVSTGGQLG